jgi:hypothetical protein
MSVPYIVGYPIKDPNNFYGFRGLAKQLYDIVGGRQAQSVSVLGLRRSGKTSLLYYLAHPSILKQHVSRSDDYVMLYLDFSTCKTPVDFYQKVYRDLLIKLTNIPEPAPSVSPTIDDIALLLCHFPNRRVVLLLDEFDHLTQGAFDQSFLLQLRVLAGARDTDLAFITASFKSLEHIGDSLGLPSTSPFYNIFFPSRFYPSELSKTEAADLIRRPAEQEGVDFTDEEVENIQAMAGTLPFLLQMSACKWFLMKRDGQSVVQEEIQKELVDEANPFFEGWWRDLEEKNRLLLGHIAQKGSILGNNLQNPGAEEELRFLKNYGLVIEEKGTLRVNGLVLATWVRRQIAKQQDEPANPNLKKTADTVAQPDSKKKLLIFLSHASEDKPNVRRLCKRLRQDGFDPWFDEDRLLPGQNWNLEIEKALRVSDVILLCFSSRSTQKEGYIQREYKRAIRYQEEKPEGAIFVIPVRLDDCEMPLFVKEWQWVDYPEQYNRLVLALKQQIDS